MKGLGKSYSSVWKKKKKKQSIDTLPEMAQVLDLGNKDLKAVIINVFKT